MKISNLFKNSERTYSFEFYPPKNEIAAVDFGINAGRLIKMRPSFVSVTCGTGGSDRERMSAIVTYLQQKVGLNTMAHFTCLNVSKETVDRGLASLRQAGIENLMLLRGDPQKGQDRFVPHPQGFAHASDLIAFTKSRYDFCIGGAAYPEVHPEAGSAQKDMEYLKIKVDAGCDFLITQLFFDNRVYFDFVRRARKAGITCRIIPGVIPLTRYDQLARLTKLSHTAIPSDFLDRLETYKDNPDRIYRTGMDFAVRQCRELLVSGAPGLHFYTLNKSRAAVEVYETLLH